jgi:uncharacterized protein
MNLHAVPIENPQGLNVILGHSHFIKTVEDLHEAMVGTVPGIRFGLAFCEASGPRLVRTSGTDPALIDLAARNAVAIGCGHTFLIVLGNAYPVNVMGAMRQVPEICQIYCATANPVQVIVAETDGSRGVLGVVDGHPPLGVEGAQDKAARHELLRKIGYKL